jgi:hypothetical protein
MATNFEFYKDEIIKRLKEGKFTTCSLMEVFSLVVNEDAKTLCNKKCAGRSCAECYIELFEILIQEHVEQPKLTKRERAFCEAVQTGWIARDCNMHLFYFSGKPKLEQGTWMTRVGQHCRIKGIEDAFMLIKDTDSEPWSVEDLLKLDVMEVQEDA